MSPIVTLWMVQMIVELLEKEQSAWTTSLEADQQELGRDIDTTRRKTILHFRIEKKNVLLKCLKLFQQKVGPRRSKHPDRAFAKSS